MQPSGFPAGAEGMPEGEFEPSPFHTALYYVMTGGGYLMTALRWGWVPLVVVLGASSAYAPPSVDVGAIFRAPPPPQP